MSLPLYPDGCNCDLYKIHNDFVDTQTRITNIALSIANDEAIDAIRTDARNGNRQIGDLVRAREIYSASDTKHPTTIERKQE